MQSYEWYAVAVQLLKKAVEEQVETFMTVVEPEVKNMYKIFAPTEEERKCFESVKRKFRDYFTSRETMLTSGAN